MCKLYKAVKWCSLLLLLCLPLKSFALDTHELNCESAVVKIVPDGSPTEWYEFRTVQKDGTTPMYSDTFVIITPKTTITIPRPRSGHANIEARGCNNLQNPICSDWKSSEEIGIPNPWDVFWKPLAPSNIIIQ